MDYYVFGMGYGDEGKGVCVDTITREYCNDSRVLIIRNSGGPQAAHNVCRKNFHHTFSQLGSGMLNPNVFTYLGPKMLIEPMAMMQEINNVVKFNKTLSKNSIMVSSAARVVSPYDMLLSRLKEHLRTQKHGTCGIGVAERLNEEGPWSQLTAIEIMNPSYVSMKSLIDYSCHQAKKYFSEFLTHNNANICDVNLIDQLKFYLSDDAPGFIYNQYRDWRESYVSIVYGDSVPRQKVNIVESAQGALISSHLGFHPYYSWTPAGDRGSEVGSLLEKDYKTIGVTRTYMTRHGIGPFPSESDYVFLYDREEHNEHNTWQGGFRTGYLDFVMLNYVKKHTVGKIDGLFVTHTDADVRHVVKKYTGPICDEIDKKCGLLLTPMLKLCQGVIHLLKDNQEITNVIENELDIPIIGTSMSSIGNENNQTFKWKGV